jgi:hypothetical protein
MSWRRVCMSASGREIRTIDNLCSGESRLPRERNCRSLGCARDDKGESDASIESSCWTGAGVVEDLRFPSSCWSFNPQSIAKPYRLFQIVDPPESSETVLNTVLVGTPQQTNRTVVMLSPHYPRNLRSAWYGPRPGNSGEGHFRPRNADVPTPCPMPVNAAVRWTS